MDLRSSPDWSLCRAVTFPRSIMKHHEAPEATPRRPGRGARGNAQVYSRDNFVFASHNGAALQERNLDRLTSNLPSIVRASPASASTTCATRRLVCCYCSRFRRNGRRPAGGGARNWGPAQARWDLAQTGRRFAEFRTHRVRNRSERKCRHWRHNASPYWVGSSTLATK